MKALNWMADIQAQLDAADMAAIDAYWEVRRSAEAARYEAFAQAAALAILEVLHAS